MFNQCADFDFTFSFLKMNRKVEIASDELFDLTSGSSGEEYIPHSSEDSSEGTDTSEVIQPVNQKESMLRFPILGKYADIRELTMCRQSKSLTEDAHLQEEGATLV